jgi:hypothetical protein
MATTRKRTDEGMYVPFTNSDLLVPPAWLPVVEIPERDRLTSIRELRTLHHRNQTSHKDPLCVSHILDLLQRWNPTYLIRARYIANRLNQSQDAITFDVTNTGRILNELIEVAADAYSEAPEQNPFESVATYRGTAYLVNSAPATYRWFWKLRQQMLDRATKDIALEAIGDPAEKRLTVWDGIDTSAEID